MTTRFVNPILPGSHPDPSICRVGDEFYLATSTFEYFPGIALFHSRDLVSWRAIGHALDRPSQLDLDGVRSSGGLYAPTLRYHDGRFYLVCTLVDGTAVSGNFVVTAIDPAGSWGEPTWLSDAPGFDPSLFFDEDGSCWMCGTVERDPASPGHTTVWMQRFDVADLCLVGERRDIWNGSTPDAKWAEGPHLYRRDGHYYLLTAEGGTADGHSVVVARSEAITGPYESCPANPVLTHRDLGPHASITSTGHADLIELPDGTSWAVLLAVRPDADGLSMLGRETFLTPVDWQEGWPVFNPGVGRVLREDRAPALPSQPAPDPRRCEDFDDGALAPEWLMIRTPRETWWSLAERPGHLRIRARPVSLADGGNPSFVGRRQQHHAFDAGAVIELTAFDPGDVAGLAVLHSEAFHVRVEFDGSTATLLERRAGRERIIASTAAGPGRVVVDVRARGRDYRFLIDGQLLGAVDGAMLSWQEAGGFFGAVVGIFAYGTGSGVADVDWFDYRGVSA